MDLKSDTSTTSVSLLASDEMIDYAFKYNGKFKSNDLVVEILRNQVTSLS